MQQIDSELKSVLSFCKTRLVFEWCIELSAVLSRSADYVRAWCGSGAAWYNAWEHQRCNRKGLPLTEIPVVSDLRVFFCLSSCKQRSISSCATTISIRAPRRAQSYVQCAHSKSCRRLTFIMEVIRFMYLTSAGLDSFTTCM